jgi:hypothetical protein
MKSQSSSQAFAHVQTHVQQKIQKMRIEESKKNEFDDENSCACSIFVFDTILSLPEHRSKHNGGRGVWIIVASLILLVVGSC